MNIKLLLSIATAALGLTVASTAGATTHSNVSGQVCEGGVPPAAASLCNAGLVLGDFNSAVADPTLEIVGDTRIWGGVAHRTTTTYQDNWTMDFGSDVYKGVFSWQPVSELFDASLTVGGGLPYIITTTVNALGDSFSIGNLTGLVTFSLDATYGPLSHNPDQVATWDLQVSQVPIPAGGLLLLTAMGGLGFARRRKQKSA